MDVMNVEAGMGGLSNALEAQKYAAEVITRPVEQQGEANQLKADVQQPSQVQLAKAVPGLGNKIDVMV